MRSIRSDGKSENEMSNGDEECSNYTRVSILNMRGGDGHNSYATNSLLQVLSSSIYIFFSFIVRHKHTQTNISSCILYSN